MLKIVPGGQTGADLGGWLAAKASGLPTGGWMPHRFETEAGSRPEYSARFGAVEVAGGYRERTRANARDSDATVWFSDPTSSGGRTTLRACRELDRPVFLVEAGTTRPSELASWIVARYVEVLNVAGNRESTSPGIGDRVERFLVSTFGYLAS